MDFGEAIKKIKNKLGELNISINIGDYDGIIVKELSVTNTLNRQSSSSKQTHIAITGDQMNMFPYIISDGYHYSQSRNKTLKKFFTLNVNVNLSIKNLSYLGLNNIPNMSGDTLKTHTCVVRSDRDNQTPQIQVSLKSNDGSEFIEFRKKMDPGSYLVMLKRRETFEYEAYGIKEQDADDLKVLNNKFFNEATITLVSPVNINHKVLPDPIKGGKNILLYGVPGSGKSHTIENDYCNDQTKIERIVFHPDYMNTDFIGQILPTIKANKTITYEFTPGPLTRIMKKAYYNPDEMYYLVIEELNRGNAPAIFGEIFQLLDRNSDGASRYSITNHNISNEVYGDIRIPVTLPSNLTILATMNTADQNVFTLDTAFQRRWIMRMIENDVSNTNHANIKILDTDVSWEKFNLIINDQILNNNSTTLSSEDKRLGAYFITYDILEEDNNNLQDYISQSGSGKFSSLFAEKVIKYLWDDAFKFTRDRIFSSDLKSLEEVIEKFSTLQGNDRFTIFTTPVKDLLITTP